ncbi:AAA family ATPase [Mucilaginibacter sp. McL0603]|uniref:AAA family ATPase n=1 Tax=Mucilaginibacter sp. McL0603 TaxID=3415670 RepID=UPI003CE897A7
MENKQKPTSMQPGQAAPFSSVYDLSLDDLKTSINQMMSDDDQSDKPFVTRSASAWLEHQSNKAAALPLFGELWFEHELCILFSDTNIGKSILAVQIGDSIAKGEGIAPFTFEADQQTVLYFDFELSGRQFESRYVDEHKSRYAFSPNLYRAELNPLLEVPDGFRNFEDYICHMIEHEVLQVNATIVIIDNITYLRTETERAKDALPLMKQLKALKEKYSLSILALAHTPKRDKSAPINRNDLQGSKMLINFCDSAFSIGESQKDSSIRYLKQIKQRNTEELYGEKNVIVYQILKPDNFLHYRHIGFSSEWDHLKQRTDEDDDERNTQIFQLHQKGFSLREIGKELNVSHQTVGRILKNLKD